MIVSLSMQFLDDIKPFLILATILKYTIPIAIWWFKIFTKVFVVVFFCTLLLLALSPVLVPLYIVYEVASTIFLEVRKIFQAKPKFENEENHSTFEESFEPPNEEEKEQNPDDPHIILGVTRGASKEEIVKAYRQLIVKNHPDKVASLDPELQRFANNRTVIIQRAYEELVESC